MAFGTHLWKLYKSLHCFLGLNISSKSVRVCAKDIFPISRNTFDKTKPVKYI